MKSSCFFIYKFNSLPSLPIIGLTCYANRLSFSAMIALKASFISSGKKERRINSNHLSFAFANLAKMLLITFSSNPDACIEVTKSAFLILRFLPLMVNANSSKGML